MKFLTSRPIVLASSSPRRLDLLQQTGFDVRVVVREAKELSCLGEGMSPAQLVEENALRKARAVLDYTAEDALILAADTVVYCDGQLFGKPVDAADAVSMLQRLSGAEHSVFTGHCLWDKSGDKCQLRHSQTIVRFAKMSDEEIAAYVESKEPMDKAGAYAVQGIGALFVSGIEGDYSTVVGLSLPLLREMLLQLAN